MDFLIDLQVVISSTKQIEAGLSIDEIRKSWENGLRQFREIRAEVSTLSLNFYITKMSHFS